MPLIKSAIKKMRQDKARTKANQEKRLALKKVLKEARIAISSETLSKAFSAIDKAAKKGLIHKNKASRQKAALAKSLTAEPQAKAKPTKAKSAKTTKSKKAKA